VPGAFRIIDQSHHRGSTLSQYRTGKTLGSGTYAIVKEAIHINTGKYYACKVINKKLMEGREYMVCVLWRRRSTMLKCPP
jgi:serine/threonine protein kinase